MSILSRAPRSILFVSIVTCAVIGSQVSLFAQNPVPQIVGSVKPSAVAPGNGRFTLTVYGANFVSGAVVNWNGQARATTFISAHELQAQITDSDVASNTAGLISVTNPAPGGGNSSASWAQVEVHSPITTMSYAYPTLGPGGTTYGGPTILADFNGDNKLDRMAGNAMAIGRGNATFRLTQVMANYQTWWGMAYGDFNNDGKLDVAYVAGKDLNNGPGQTIQIAQGNGDGTFNLGTRLRSADGQFFLAVAVGDFNADGKLDIVASESGPRGGTDIFLGNGDGTFTMLTRYTGEIMPENTQIGDFNGDGKLDLLVEDAHRRFYLALGNGDGTFQYPGSVIFSASAYPCSGDGLHDALVDDFNGDGKLDIAFCYEYYGNNIQVFINNGDGTFQPPVIYPVPITQGGFFSAAVGDFNSDGVVDIAVTQYAGLTVYLGNGDGSFKAPQSVTLPGTESWNGDVGFELGDFNSDGQLDFIFNGWASFRAQ
jgi:hypothetical protein